MIFALTTNAWQDLSDISSVLIVALFIIAGIFLGYALRGLVGRWQAESIERKMKLREEEAVLEKPVLRMAPHSAFVRFDDLVAQRAAARAPGSRARSRAS